MTNASVSASAEATQTAPGARSGLRLPTQWLGVAPFFVFALMFLILPTAYRVIGAFQNNAGEFTLENIVALSQPSILAAYWISIRISLASSTYLCTGYAGCQAAGYGNYGYRQASSTMYWRMYSGHNCTNYVAYRLIQSGMPDVRPWEGSGNASNWGVEMASITDQTPTVGSIAWYKPHVTPAGANGHVAIVFLPS